MWIWANLPKQLIQMLHIILIIFILIVEKTQLLQIITVHFICFCAFTFSFAALYAINWKKIEVLLAFFGHHRFESKSSVVTTLIVGQDRKGTAQLVTRMCRWHRVSDSTCFLLSVIRVLDRQPVADTPNARSRRSKIWLGLTTEPNGTSGRTCCAAVIQWISLGEFFSSCWCVFHLICI